MTGLSVTLLDHRVSGSICGIVSYTSPCSLFKLWAGSWTKSSIEQRVKYSHYKALQGQASDKLITLYATRSQEAR